jgi:hypothetical protein
MANAGDAAVAAAIEKKVVHAYPTKDFFVRMITKDIALRDCIFDLLDNSIDGSRRTASKRTGDKPYDGFEVKIYFSRTAFSIADNCGGISKSDAINHAFHFGRKAGAPADVAGGIGLYGIGMKRAIFKIGRKCEVSSQTAAEAFRVDVDVDTWMKSDQWDFAYEDIARKEGKPGALITISDLNDGVAQLFGDPAFANGLIKDMARDYAFFIQKGLKVLVCGRQVPSYQYRLSSSNSLRPLVDSFVDGGVSVRILAGLVEAIPDDVPDDLRPDKVERMGWFVICNDRVVLAGDKSDRTVWGNDNFQVWHGQYSGFAGLVFFNAEDQTKLPWNTTKRGVDLESPLYRRTVTKMKTVTAEFIKYSQIRSGALAEAKAAEGSATFVPVTELKRTQAMKLPQLKSLATKPGMTNILYQKPTAEIEEIKKALSSPRMAAKDVGIYTFEYFRRVELGKK